MKSLIFVVLLLAGQGEVVASGLHFVKASTDKDGLRTIEMKNQQNRVELLCAVVFDSCSLPLAGKQYSLKTSAERLYVGDNVALFEAGKEAGHFRLLSIAAK